MKNLFIFLVLSTIILIFAGIGISQNKRTDTVASTLTIDVKKDLGKLPYLFRTGVFNGNVIPTGYYLDKFITDHKPGAVEFYIAHTTIRPSIDMKDLERRLSEWDPVSRKVAEKGGEVVIEIAAMPSWLTSNPSKKPVNPAIGDNTPVGNLSPPKDYNKWADMVGLIVNHFNNELKIKAKYTIWGEPDTVWWQGTEEEYFKLYKYAVLGAKKADPEAKIGGPAVSNWKGQKDEKSKMPLMHNFILYASKTPLPEVGLKRLPIDYINWHQFNANPLNPRAYAEPATTIRGWLKKYGYSEDTEFLIGEWIIWQYFGKEHGFLNVEHDNEINASYIISSLMAMDKAGIERHSYAYLIDSVPGKEFIGDFGLFTKRGIIKANFNSFKAISMLESKRVQVDEDDLTVQAIATNNNGKISILISNFVPWGKMLRTTCAQILKEKGYTKEQMKNKGITKKQLEEIISGERPVDKLKIPESSKKDLRQALAYLKSYRERQKIPVYLTLKLKNTEAGSYKYEKYLIDSEHSNSYRLRDKIYELARSKRLIVKEINESKGVRLEKVEEGVKPDLKSFDIKMQPYSVVLLIFTPE